MEDTDSEQLSRRTATGSEPSSLHCSKGIITALADETEEQMKTRLQVVARSLTDGGWNAVTFSDFTTRRYKAVSDHMQSLRSRSPLSAEQHAMGQLKLLVIKTACSMDPNAEITTTRKYGIRALKSAGTSQPEELDAEFASCVLGIEAFPVDAPRAPVWKSITDLEPRDGEACHLHAGDRITLAVQKSID